MAHGKGGRYYLVGDQRLTEAEYLALQEKPVKKADKSKTKPTTETTKES